MPNIDDLENKLLICLSVCLFFHPRFCLFVCLSVYPFIRSPACLSVCLPACPSVCLSVCLSVHPSFHLSIRPSLYVRLSIYLSVFSSIHASCLSGYLSQFTVVYPQPDHKNININSIRHAACPRLTNATCHSPHAEAVNQITPRRERGGGGTWPNP